MKIARAFRAVAWAFFGVRDRGEFDHDTEQLKPQHLIVVGLICAAIFVAVLVVLVKWVVGSGVAAG